MNELKTMSWWIIPNIITILRMLLVPLVVWAILQSNYTLALVLFVISGISDGVDGFLARHFHWVTRLGSLLDPLADKFLLVSSYLTLGWMGQLHYDLVGLVIFRDLWIILGFTIYYLMFKEAHFAPTLISKLNTLLQIILIVLVLLYLSILPVAPWVLLLFEYAVLTTTLLSLIDYTWVWGKRAYQQWRLQ